MASAEQFEPLQRWLRQALQAGVEQVACTRTANTCTNLLKLWPALWGFRLTGQRVHRAAMFRSSARLLGGEYVPFGQPARQVSFADEDCVVCGHDCWLGVGQAV